MSKLGAVILAAGISSRMNMFKPLLRVGDALMITEIIEMMRQAGCKPIAVVTGFRHQLLEEQLKDKDIIFVRNEDFWKNQMLDSILLGLDAIAKDCRRIIISPADVPAIKRETMKMLLETDGEFVRPLYLGAPGHPVIIKSEIIPLLKHYKGAGGLRGASESGGILLKELIVDDRGVVLDSDTKEDYLELLSYNYEINRNKQQQLMLEVQLWADSIISYRDVQLIELIGITGSLQNACRCMHLDPCKAGEKINEMECKLGFEILERAKTVNLTEKGKRFADAYQSMYNEIHQQAQASFKKYFASVEGI